MTRLLMAAGCAVMALLTVGAFVFNGLAAGVPCALLTAAATVQWIAFRRSASRPRGDHR